MPVSSRKSDDALLLRSDKYDVERVIGRGGMGTVLEARHARLGHRVAIKVLGAELCAVPELVARFEREARAAGALSSPHAVRVFDIDQTEDGTPFIVMELLDGRDLAHVVERDGPQPIGVSVRWVIEACDAIAEAHRLGIVHRDIKPSNLLLCFDTGAIKVLDFGIAKRVAAKEAVITLGVAPLGTPQYMSPEQVRCAKDVDARADIWSLGVTLYELVCGRPPFDHDVPQACIAAIVVDPVPDPRRLRPNLPDELAEVILRALAKDPDERFQRVDDLVLALAPFADTSVHDSGALRVITAARRTSASDSTTLEGDGAASVLELRPDMRRSRRTIPPAVRRANATPPRRARRARATLGLASAAVLGCVAFVTTPRCVSGSEEVSEATVARGAVLAEGPDPAAKAAALPPFAASSAVSGASARDGAAPSARPSFEAPRGVRTKPASVAKMSARPSGELAPRGQLASPVHGGISGPGF